MLRSSADLKGMTLHATDGELGKVEEFYFDDATWTLRYFVVRTGGWLSGRSVLLSPPVVASADWDTGELVVNLTKQQVADSPDVSTEQPVSRLAEIEYLKYYEQPPYWMLGADVGGAAVALDAAMRAAAADAEAAGQAPPSHLRSSREVLGYDIAAADGQIGHLDGVLLDEDSWEIRYLVVDTTNWWPGGEVVISPKWVERVSWGGRHVKVGLSRAAIKSSPAYDRGRPVDADYEKKLADHYDRS
jgi:PRC-barrel domain